MIAAPAAPWPSSPMGDGASLGDELVVAGRALFSQSSRLSFAAAAGDDPLRIDLPPVTSGGSVTPEVLAVVAALYLFAELEEAGVVVVAELLAQSRHQLRVPVDTAGKLERFALDARDMPSRGQREELHARLFGLGRSVSLARGGNHGFLQQLVTLCGALAQVGEEGLFQRTPSPTTEARVRQAAVALVAGLAAHVGGDVVWTGRRCHQQLVRALDILNDPALGAWLGVRGFAPVIRAVAGSDAPDVDAAIARGRAGQQVLLWVRSVMPQLEAPVAARPLVTADDAVILHATRWLVQVGCAPGAPCDPRARRPGERTPAPPAPIAGARGVA